MDTWLGNIFKSFSQQHQSTGLGSADECMEAAHCWNCCTGRQLVEVTPLVLYLDKLRSVLPYLAIRSVPCLWGDI
jgi:glycyl-tRNA synthetase alpha subunit